MFPFFSEKVQKKDNLTPQTDKGQYWHFTLINKHETFLNLYLYTIIFLFFNWR